MVPKPGDILYLIVGRSIQIFEILKVNKPVLVGGFSYKFDICVLAGDWPLNYIYVEEYILDANESKVLIMPDTYLIFDEETFSTYLIENGIT